MKFKRIINIEIPRYGNLTVPDNEIWKVDFSKTGTSELNLINTAAYKKVGHYDSHCADLNRTNTGYTLVGGMRIFLSDSNQSSSYSSDKGASIEFGGTFYGIAFTAD